MNLIQKILEEWAYRVHDGMPNVKNPMHMVHLEEALDELKFPRQAKEILLNKLRETEWQARKVDTNKISTFGSEKTRDTAISKGTHTALGDDEVQDKTQIPIEDQEQPTEMSRKERRRLKTLEKNEDKLNAKQKKELRDLRDKRDNEKVDTALHMTTSEHNALSAEYGDIEDRIEDGTATEEDLKRKEELEEKGIGAGTAESQAGEAITHWTLRMLKAGYTIEQIEEYLTKLVSNPDHVLGGTSTKRAWVPRGMAAAKKIIELEEIGGIDNIKTISWDTPEGRQAMGVSPDFKTAGDMFIETEDGRTIGISLKKDGQVRILSGGWKTQQEKLRQKMLENDTNGELTKKKFRKTDGTLTTDKNDPDIEMKNGKPVITTSIDEFDRQSGAHTHKAEVNAAAIAGATDILDNIEKEGMDGADGKELEKIIENEDGYGDDITGERLDHLEPYVIIDNPDFDPNKKPSRNNPRQIKKMGHKRDEDGKIVPVEGREAREQGAKQFLQRIKNGPKTKDNPDGYSADDLVVFAKIIQKSDIRNRHEKHHDDMRAADNNLTKRTMDAINRDPALREAAKDFVLDSLHLDKILGLGLKEEDGVDEFVNIYGIGEDGVAMNVETLSNLFGEKFASTYAEARAEIDQIKKDLANGDITQEEAERRVKEQKDRVYAVIKQDLEVDYESNTIKFKQEFPNPDYDPSKPTIPNPDYDKNEPEGPGNRKELNAKMHLSEYSLWDWFSRAKGLGRAVAMELSQSEFLIFALENGTPDVNQWPEKEQARWFNKVNNKINKEEEERIKLGEKPPFPDLEKQRKRNNRKWGKVDNKAMKAAEKKRLEK